MLAKNILHVAYLSSLQCNRSTRTIHVTTSNRFKLYELVSY